jgi:hypothetical protein
MMPQADGLLLAAPVVDVDAVLVDQYVVAGDAGNVWFSIRCQRGWLMYCSCTKVIGVGRPDDENRPRAAPDAAVEAPAAARAFFSLRKHPKCCLRTTVSAYRCDRYGRPSTTNDLLEVSGAEPLDSAPSGLAPAEELLLVQRRDDDRDDW